MIMVKMPHKYIIMSKDKINFFIVDDDPFSAGIFRQYLIFEGYRKIKVFDNGKDCLDNLGDDPDVIILDHYMSPLNGLDVLQRVKEKKPGVYVIYISSGLEASLKNDCLKQGAFCYIIKGENEFGTMIHELRKIETAIKLLKTNTFSTHCGTTLSYNRNAFSLS